MQHASDVIKSNEVMLRHNLMYWRYIYSICVWSSDPSKNKNITKTVNAVQLATLFVTVKLSFSTMAYFVPLREACVPKWWTPHSLVLQQFIGNCNTFAVLYIVAVFYIPKCAMNLFTFASWVSEWVNDRVTFWALNRNCTKKLCQLSFWEMKIPFGNVEKLGLKCFWRMVLVSAAWPVQCPS